MMKMMPEAAIDIAANVKTVRSKIDAAYAAALKVPVENPDQKQPTLVAVSKTKSVLMIKKAYDQGIRHFGENYVKEMVIKVKDRELAKLCPDIKWHYIGHMQRNKISKFKQMPDLYMLQTIESKESASSVDKRWKTVLNVMVQVNTSGEKEKGGVPPDKCCDLVEHIRKDCPNLKFCGLMTIGSWEHSYGDGENPDFIMLCKCRDEVSNKFNIPVNDIDLSMGMSADFEQAIASGSSYVRVGSTIFGPRDYGVVSNTNTASQQEETNPQEQQQEQQ